MSRTVIRKATYQLEYDIEAVWSVISQGEWIGSTRTTVTVSGERYIVKLKILHHEELIISYVIEEPVPFQATGVYGTQRLEAIGPGKTLLTRTGEAESIDEDNKDKFSQQTQGLVNVSIAELVELLEKGQKGDARTICIARTVRLLKIGWNQNMRYRTLLKSSVKAF
ncbi:hypothetical protein F52700_12228 [Fusarium sp. NRRL 52700]|nr:hypothetical protein F52700_12228 [Fusarium sp. NRRL 52700]